MPEEVKATAQFQHDPSYTGRLCAHPNLIFMALRLFQQERKGDAPLDKVHDELIARYQLNRGVIMEKGRKTAESADEISLIAKTSASSQALLGF
jgi:hypothetical protein